jgi:O-glycosyl hydrolase
LLGIVLLSGVLTVTLSRQSAYAASAVTINGGTTYQTMDGFGFSEAFGQADGIESLASGPQQQVLNDLLSPTSGAGLTILRNLLPSDSGDTIEPNNPGSPSATPSYSALGTSEGQVWFAQQAKNYGVTQIYGDAWSAPGYMKTNGSESNGGALCGTPGATCSSGDWRQAYANYLTQYAKDYSNAGVPLTEIGAFNEPDYTASYSSMVMNPTQTANFITYLKPTLTAAGLNPQVVCCDPTGWSEAQSYASAVASNSTANSDVNIFSSHGYSSAPNSPLTSANGKHVWETEWGIFDSPDDNAWDDGGQSDGFNWAQRIYTGLTAANLSAFFWWYGASPNATDNGYLVDVSGSTVTAAARLWAFANYSRFIRPGAVRIGASSGDSNLDVSAYRNTNGTISVVVQNSSTSAISATYTLQNTTVANGTTVTPYLTNGSNNTAQQSTTSVSNGAFSSTIPARSLETYVLSGTSSPTPTPTQGTTPTPTPTHGTTPTPTPTQGTTPTPTPTHGTTPTPTQGTTPTPTPTQVSGASCSVHYAITSSWTGGFGAALTITNTGSTAINGWSLGFSFPNGQTITQLWNGTYTQSGSAVTITNVSYNGSIPAGQSVSSEPGFNGTWNGTNGPPTAFTLNGSPCSVV